MESKFSLFKSMGLELPPLTDEDILNFVEDKFKYEFKNFYSAEEVAQILNIEAPVVVRKVNHFELDAIIIESLVRIPYNSLVNWIFYNKEWKEAKKVYYEWIKKRGGKNIRLL